jgi:hypothetical protein
MDAVLDHQRIAPALLGTLELLEHDDSVGSVVPVAVAEVVEEGSYGVHWVVVAVVEGAVEKNGAQVVETVVSGLALAGVGFQ